jgi:adenosylmethionine-8-amino-7-oxononanoate aminotransferase
LTTTRAVGFGLEQLPRLVRGEGSYLFDASGRRYLDGSGGPAAFCIGHANREVNAAIAAQLEQVACAYRYLFTTDALEQLTELILGKFGSEFGHALYCGSGSEAVECSLKVALQYWHARGLRGKRAFIARERSYHGTTLGALSMSGFRERRVPYEGSLLDVSFVSAANEYRPAFGSSMAAGSRGAAAAQRTIGAQPASGAQPTTDAQAGELVAALAGELEERIRQIGPERVAAFIFEPVVGAAGGVVPAPPGYAEAVRAVCDRNDVLLIADEVMCGAGRCGTWRALDHDRVKADIIAVAKGLAGGYIPLGATVVSKVIANTIVAEEGTFLTGHTYSGHTAACAAGLAVQRIIEREKLVERVAASGPHLKSALQSALAQFEEVGDVRGRGFFLGVEFVQDRATRQPFPADRGISHEIGRRAFENGLICYPCAGNVGDGTGDTIIIAPPFNASEAELAELVEKFARSVGQVLRA